MTLKMTTAQVVETLVNVTNSSYQTYTYPDDHTRQTTDTPPGFKSFTMHNYTHEIYEVTSTLSRSLPTTDGLHLKGTIQ